MNAKISINDPNLLKKVIQIEKRLDDLEKRIERIERIVGPQPFRPGPPMPPGPVPPGPGPKPEPFRF